MNFYLRSYTCIMDNYSTVSGFVVVFLLFVCLGEEGWNGGG